MRYLIGIDIGTTGAKCLLMDEKGRTHATDFQEYPLHLPKPGWAEQDPEDWWAATKAGLRALLEKSRVSPSHIAGMSLSGQMHGLVCLDADGKPLRNAILWCDQRTTAQCREIEQAVGGRAKVVQLASNPALEGFTLPKLLWVRRHDPKAYAKTRTVLLPKDYVRYRLTGALGMEMSDAAGTLMLDVRKRRWSREILRAVGVDAALLPPLAESPDIAGAVTAEAARETGLPEGLPVAYGGADNTCAAVGNGVIEEGVVAVSIGTSGTVIAPATGPMRDKLGRAHTFNHSVPGLWYVMGVMQAAGLSLKWLRDNFGALERAVAAETGADAYEYLCAGAADVPPGAEGLVWLPYLNGERTPHLDPYARGVLFGVSPAPHQGACRARGDGGRGVRPARFAGDHPRPAHSDPPDPRDGRRRQEPAVAADSRRRIRPAGRHDQRGGRTGVRRGDHRRRRDRCVSKLRRCGVAPDQGDARGEASRRKHKGIREALRDVPQAVRLAER